ncbi:toxin [Pseudomonas sp. COR58]|uniref:Toxin n=1 Tax=Pseudomonas ekonensis TaxID=2842353 RepID=A0ABS6P932_9PSED|nr:RHS repeat-associated core domain-containing protein [Pseudomonas ekonensis]MBV4456984.1 toxin [Pseudomonas ekonensis]
MNVHRRTPAVTVNDGRGLAVRQVAYLRTLAEDDPVGLVTRFEHDMAGHLIAQRDPRLAAANLINVYALNGAPVRTDSVDAGWRLNLPGAAGQVVRRWDARGFHWRSTYDPLLRLVRDEETGGADAETFTYADASADAGHNLRGRTIELTDPAGTVRWPGFGLLGETLEESRSFGDGDTFVTRWRYGPLGARLEQTDAGGHRQQADFDLAGQLRRTHLQLNGQASWQTVLSDAQYNAAGQIVEQQAGNGAVSHWRYDPADGRLIRQQAQVTGQAALQDFGYEYDPAGNLTRILDHAFTPSHFANRRVDGHRSFTYDSLYRLHTASGHDDAPPSDIPGLPQPTDPADRRPYVQTYTYDHGNNLTRLRHVRDGANHTRRMFIDPASNRGARWAEGDAEPVIGNLFDRHGNLLALQLGQPLQWNARDRLDTITLVQRPSGPDDQEHYRYSQGVRVLKRHDFHNAANSHFHEVRYLPGLEIRTKDNGETLHVITLAAGPGNVRCLHWERGQPPGIDADQLRYTLSDPLGSCVMELDARAQLISHEGYYPFGATAWMTARSSLEVGYKTIRYSGKEMDVSGLYDYGARHYAPWLQRWVSADPGGAADGLNLFAFVGNGPLRFIDAAGQSKEEWQIMNYSDFIAELGTEAATALAQIDNVIHQTGIGKELLKNLAAESLAAVVGYYGGYGAGEVLGALAPDVNAIPFVGGIISGNAGGDLSGSMADAAIPSARWIRPLVPQTSTMSIAAIDKRRGISASETGDISVPRAAGFFLNRIVGSVIPAMNVILNMGSRVQEAEDIQNRLTPAKIEKIDSMLAEWKIAVNERWDRSQAAYKTLKVPTVNPAAVFPNVNYMTPEEVLAPIHQSDLKQKTAIVLDLIAQAQKGMDWYKEMGTTDNQYLMKQSRLNAEAAKRH